MRTIAIIPARGGSKRLPGKNIQPLGAHPLIAHSIMYAKENPTIIDEVYVSTDDEKIKSVSLQYGAKVIDRPIHLSGDNEPTVTALNHVVGQLANEVDNIVLLQATNPLRPANLLKECFEFYVNGGYDSCFTVTRNHQKFGKIVNNKFVPYNYEMGQRSQDLEPLYFENGLLYICKATAIKEGKIMGTNHSPFIINHPFAEVDIDTLEDFEYAEYMLSKELDFNH